MIVKELKKELQDLIIDTDVIKMQKEMKQKEVSNLQKKISKDQTIINENEKKINNIRGRINRFNEKTEVSNHAILRYLERVYSLDIENIKSEILTEDIVEFAINNGDGKYHIENEDTEQEYTVVVKDNVIVTLYQE